MSDTFGAGVTGGSISVSAILSDSFRVIARNPVTILGSAGVFNVLPQAAGLMILALALAPAPQPPFDAMSPPMPPPPPPPLPSQGAGGDGNFLFVFLPLLFAIVVLLVLAALSHASILSAVAQDRCGERPSFGKCLKAGFRIIPALVSLYMLADLAFVAGFIVLIIPCVILMLMWSVAGPVLIIEKCRVIEAFGRSRTLSQGHRLKILVLLVTVTVASLGLMTLGNTWLSGLTHLGSPEQSRVILGLVPVVLYSLTSSYLAVMVSTLYFALKEARDIPEASALSAIFS